MDVDELTIRPLASDTWPAFAELVAQYNGVFGGCWCTGFHTLSRDKDRTYESNRDLKCRLVAEERAHAALVFDGDGVAWASTDRPRNCPTSTTVRSTRRDWNAPATTGSRASSWTVATGGTG